MYPKLYCIQGYTEEEGTKRATKIFKSLDHNGDGNLEEEEFVKVDVVFKQESR